MDGVARPSRSRDLGGPQRRKPGRVLRARAPGRQPRSRSPTSASAPVHRPGHRRPPPHRRRSSGHGRSRTSGGSGCTPAASTTRPHWPTTRPEASRCSRSRRRAHDLPDEPPGPWPGANSPSTRYRQRRVSTDNDAWPCGSGDSRSWRRGRRRGRIRRLRVARGSPTSRTAARVRTSRSPTTGSSTSSTRTRFLTIGRSPTARPASSAAGPVAGRVRRGPEARRHPLRGRHPRRPIVGQAEISPIGESVQRPGVERRPAGARARRHR